MRFFQHATGRPLAAVATFALAGGCHGGNTLRTADGDSADVATGSAAASAAAPAVVPAVVSSPDAPRAALPSPASTQRSPRRVVVAGVDLTGIGYDMGSATAPIVIVDFSDFGCPFCASHARQTLPALEREYVATGAVFYKYVPFVMGMFPNGDNAARAAECAADQGKFWPMHDRLFAAQAGWKRSPSPSQLSPRRRTAGSGGARLALRIRAGR